MSKVRLIHSHQLTIEHVYRKETWMAQAVGKFDYRLQPFPHSEGFAFFPSSEGPMYRGRGELFEFQTSMNDKPLGEYIEGAMTV